MPVCCIGPVCVPYTAIWPLLVFALKYLWDRFGSMIRRVLGLEPKAAAAADVATLPEAVAVPYVVSMEDWKRRLSKSQRPLIVDFTATWCKPCKKIAPLFGQLAAQYGDSADFVKVDIDDQADLATEANVMAVPTFQVYVDGLAKDQLQGANQADLCRLVRTHVDASKKAS